jgi:hypothetical protein
MVSEGRKKRRTATQVTPRWQWRFSRTKGGLMLSRFAEVPPTTKTTADTLTIVDFQFPNTLSFGSCHFGDLARHKDPDITSLLKISGPWHKNGFR